MGNFSWQLQLKNDASPLSLLPLKGHRVYRREGTEEGRGRGLSSALLASCSGRGQFAFVV